MQRKKTNAACIIIWCIYLSPYSVKSNLPRLVKKADEYNTSLYLLTLSGKQSLGACMEVRQCGPSHIINEEARTLETRGAFIGVDLEVVKTIVCGTCARLPRISSG